MMKKIDFSRHSIADIKGWNENEALEVQPDFQRRAVWSSSAKIMLIDSIIKGIPLPKIFIASKIKDGKTYRIVIDGQQRITAILSFINDEFKLSSPYSGEYEGKKYSELPEDAQGAILSFRLDFNEFENYTDDDMREIYNRVNKYTFALNKQELRKADFPGDFLSLAEKLSVDEFFDDARIFTTANRRRLGDVEYTSELLAILIDGPQDKKSTLDNFYMNFATWEESEKDRIEGAFLEVLSIINRIFSFGNIVLKESRFRQKSDFYSLFGAIATFNKEGLVLEESKLEYLAEDFWCLDDAIGPHERGKLGEYASRCLSDANSFSSRKWRMGFIYNFLVSASNKSNEIQVTERLEFFTKVLDSFDDGGFCPPATEECPICKKEDTYMVPCYSGGDIFLSNAMFAHKECLEKTPNNYLYHNE